jgi:D-alanyl-D-alanine carboxypeptidase
LSNVEGASAGRMANDLAAIVFGAPYEIPRARTAITLEAGVLKQYAGEYRIASPPIDIVVTLDNGKLLALVAGRLKLALSAESDTTFFSSDVSAEIRFHKDSGGRVTGLTLRMDGTDVPAQRVK